MTIFSGQVEDLRRRLTKIEAATERGAWVAFTPTLKQGTTTFVLAAASYAYYHYAAGVMEIDAYCKVSSGTGQAGQAVHLGGWPTDYLVAGRSGRRAAGGSFRAKRSGARAAVGHPVTFFDDLAGEGDTSAKAGDECYGETNSGWAYQAAANDEFSIYVIFRPGAA